jgi:murein DD-endopeptidase MepM/ murein hydrolase activator NlpD
MPEGTPVVAARDGVVRKARGDSTSGGCDVRYARDANYVVVLHESALETQYLHLSRVVVKEGDVVREGQLLGHSGRTGWACGAHLHFKVARRETDSWNNPSVPARLKGFGQAPKGTWVFTEACRVSWWRQILDSSRKQISTFSHGQNISSTATGRTSEKGRAGNPSVSVSGP